MILTPLLAQSLKEIPADPTPLWIVAAAVVLGCMIIGVTIGRAFTASKEASAGTRAAVTEMLAFCQGESVRRETVISKICDTHEVVGTRLADNIHDLKTEFVKHAAATGSKLGEIHDDIKAVTPRRGHKTPGDA